MKKIISLVMILTMCLSLIAMATSCAPKHPIEEFKERIQKADSYQMTITVSDIPLLGSFSMITKVDGNIQYTPAVMFSEEQYIEIVGDKQYVYSKDASGTWSKTQQDIEEDDDNIYDSEAMLELFNPENYEKVDGKENSFKQKDDVDFENYDDVIITIEKDSCTMEMSATSEGMVMGMKIEFSKINEVELTLPTVG